MSQTEHKTLLKFVGKVIFDYRRASGVSQKDLAEALECSVATINRWEHGKHAMPLKLWSQFLSFIGRDPREPYPSAHAEKGDVASAERIVTGTVIEPQLVAQLKTMQDILPVLVREAVRAELAASRDIVPLQVREAVREALRDSQSAIGELRDIKAQMAPTLAEMKLVKDQVIVAVKEVLAEHKPTPTGRAHQRDRRTPCADRTNEIPRFEEDALGVSPIRERKGVKYDARDTVIPEVWAFIDKHYRNQYQSRNPIKYPVTHGAIIRGVADGWAAVCLHDLIDADTVSTDLTPATVYSLLARDDVREVVATAMKKLADTKLKYAESKDSGLTVRLAVVCGLVQGARDASKDEPQLAAGSEDDDDDLL